MTSNEFIIRQLMVRECLSLKLRIRSKPLVLIDVSQSDKLFDIHFEAQY